MRLKGSYTVEGAWIISWCLLIISFTILLAFNMYSESYTYIDNSVPEKIDAVEKFRLYSLGKDIAGIVVGE